MNEADVFRNCNFTIEITHMLVHILSSNQMTLFAKQFFNFFYLISPNSFFLDESSRATQHASLIERLNHQFPNDIGCFSVYFLNVVLLQPGEALYLGPNEPHAYLDGGIYFNISYHNGVIMRYYISRLH